jgi:CheY-like chemotaxis protein
MLPAQFLVLLVEDNAADVFLLREAFRTLPGRPELQVVRDGREALAVLHKAEPPVTPDLVLLDLSLPLLNGHEVLQAIKTDPRTRTIPVIIFSSSSAARDIQKSYELQANSYVQKPMDLDGFCQVVSALHAFWLQAVQLPRPLPAPGPPVALP